GQRAAGAEQLRVGAQVRRAHVGDRRGGDAALVRVPVRPPVPREVLEDGGDARGPLALGERGRVAGDDVRVVAEGTVPDGGRAAGDVDGRGEGHRDAARELRPPALLAERAQLFGGTGAGRRTGAVPFPYEGVDALAALALVVDGDGGRDAGHGLVPAQRLVGEQRGGVAADEDPADLGGADVLGGRARVRRVDAHHEPLGQLEIGRAHVC